MRIDSPAFSAVNKSPTANPVFVVAISFDLDNQDVHYVTSGPVNGLTQNIINEKLTVVSSTSQKVNPDKALSTIGSVKFSVLDEGFSDIMNAKIAQQEGLNGRRIQFYVGDTSMLWSEYTLAQTQVVDQSISYENGVYTISCADAQRITKKQIFDPYETALTASITAEQTSIDVFDASGLHMVYQLPSAEGKTLLRGYQQRGDHPYVEGLDHMGLVMIENDDEFEIAMYTAKSGNTLSGMIRGLFGTRALPVEVVPGSTSQDAPKVTEYVYLEGPAPKIAYALYTGSLYGHPGEQLPDHWHAGVSTDYIATSSFINIGSDLWDLSNDDAGFPVVIKNPGRQEAKKFIEQNIFYLIVVFPRIRTTGEIALKRLAYISAGGGYDRLLNQSNVHSFGNFRENLRVVRNVFALRWDYDDRRDLYRRTSTFVDQDSIQLNTLQPVKEVKLRVLTSNRHSDQLIREHFENLRVRYANPPYELSLTLTRDQNDLEVGDIVRVSLPQIKDTYANGPLNRNFEVQSVQIDWKSGRVQVQLFATTRRPSTVPPEEVEPPGLLFQNPIGTEINSTNFPGAVSSAGGVTTITGDITLTGGADVNDPGSIYYCLEDLTVDASAVVTITNNVQIRADGFIQNNGDVDGKGRGFAGGVANNSGNTANLNGKGIGNPPFGMSQGTDSPMPAQCRGTPGIGSTISQRGLTCFVWLNNSGDGYGRSLTEIEGMQVNGTDFPRPNVTVSDAGVVSGLPSDLRGTSGSSGQPTYQVEYWRTRDDNKYTYHRNPTQIVSGGAGGAGGAGLVILSKGMANGAGGRVDLSGANGALGALTTQLNLAGGAGAGGAPGAFVYGALDSTQSFPNLDEGFILNQGESPQQGSLYGANWVLHNVANEGGIYYNGSRVVSSLYVGAGAAEENLVDQNSHIIFLDTRRTPVPEQNPYVEELPDFSLTEYLNTPSTVAGDRSTIEVSVTPPAADNYSYSVVEYRKLGIPVWTRTNVPASPEAVFEVPSDGSTYEVRCRAVSKTPKASQTGIIKQITVADIQSRTNAQLDIDFPLQDILGLRLDNNETTFIGLEPNFVWNDENSELSYFNYYQVEIYSGGVLLRVEQTKDPKYTYTYQNNRADYYDQNSGDIDVYLDIRIDVTPVSIRRNNLGLFHKGNTATLTRSATTEDNRWNLRFYLAFEQQMLDDIAAAGGGGGVLTTYYQDEEPSSPTTGDIWFDSNDGNMIYRYNGSDWIAAQDSGIATAINAAQTAQTTADGKALVFYQTSQPVSASSGDLWYSSTTKQVRRYNGATWDVIGNAYNNTSDLTDDAGLGDSANWDNVTGPNKPEDNATDGSTWGDNITGQPLDAEIFNNLLDRSQWIAGDDSSNPTDNTRSLAPSGSGVDSRIIATGPYDELETLWRTEHENWTTNAGLAFDLASSNPVYVDERYTHRICCFMRCDNQGLIDVQPSIASTLLTLDTSTQPAEPRVIVDGSLPKDAEWYLIVLVVHATTALITSASGIAGIYHPATGKKISTLEEFKFNPAAGAQNQNILLTEFKYKGVSVAGVWAEFARPRVDRLDGNEPSIAQLMNTPKELFVNQTAAPFTFLVNSAGLIYGDDIPTNIVVTRISAGRYEIEHGTGQSGWPIIVSPQGPTIQSFAYTENGTDIIVRLYDGASVETDGTFSIMLDARYRQ